MSRTLGQLLYSLRKGDLLLPNFQRPFVWNSERWQSLIASIFLEYPIGQALIGTEADSQTMSVNKPLSIPEKVLRETLLKKTNIKLEETVGLKATQYLQKGQAYSCDYLLDGQQRLTALDLIFGTAYHFADGNELNRNYRLRWFLNLNKLGLKELKWLNLRELQHEEACEVFVFVKYKKTDRSCPFYYETSDSDLANFCTVKDLQEQNDIEEGIYLPLDKLYIENDDDKSLQFDPTNFWIDLFEDRQDIIISQTIEGKKLKENFQLGNIDKSKYDEEWKKLKRYFLSWRSQLQQMLSELIKFQFPVLEVPSKEFNRLSGIFSVINMGGVELETFDLLVAKTTTADSSLREVMKSICLQSIEDFRQSINLLPEPAREDDIENFWTLGDFLGEKNEDAEQVVKGAKFPERIARSFAQTIVLHAKISEALGNTWSTRTNPISHCKKNKFNLDLAESTNPQEAARSILQIEDWGYSDKLILSLSRQTVQDVQEQAAKQLLRAYFFMKAKLGIPKLSFLPYRQMDLVLATILTDSTWSRLCQDPTGTIIKKIQWWYWGSLFGGAYQKAHSSIDKRVLADIPRLLAYISKPTIKWNEVSDLNNKSDSFEQLSLINTEKPLNSDDYKIEQSCFTEVPIIGSDGKVGNRFEMICDVVGYSNKEALMTFTSKAMGLALLSFTIRNGLPDFKFRDKSDNNHELKRGSLLHTGRNDLQADHLYAVNSWYKFTGEKVDRNDDHPINSPLNHSWISAKANRYWSDHPSFMKLELQSALEGNQDSIDFLHHHLLSVEAVEHEYRDILLSSEEKQKDNAKKVLEALIEKRFEKLRQEVLSENPEN
ncbi:hypothetical protein C7Y66_20300 [Chroococcidiopsis sp. CCALA 051]|uniref:DUF262 domain-containing protein n=1 Tax=Chroococcidiopsis sp. CCALA 051 TaxID=869949 RepID=UPI000D0DFF9B|nr:DUF262 domain-containing protein [Chroococcidiopsis sp. CCALA 051]PSM47327.1 hypothetical protein C7Y66_20300 [Chroococcidiopsis sp. CCALA 051]